MATMTTPAIAPDVVLSFEINLGMLHSFLEARSEKGPRLKCFEGSVTLVSPGKSHEAKGNRLKLLIAMVCLELRIKFEGLQSTTWKLPRGSGDTAYEADAAYYVQSVGRAEDDQVPVLAIEIVVSNPATKALRAGAALGIPELWVLDVLKGDLTFYHLATRGKDKGSYVARPRSRAFPFLTTADVLGRLDDPAGDDLAFLENGRAWAAEVLAPRVRGD